MVDYPDVALSDHLGDRVVIALPVPQAALRRRRDRAYWTELIFGRTVPACLFSVLIVYKLVLVSSSLAAFRHGLPGIGVVAGTANQTLGLVYAALLVFLYVIRLPKKSGERSPVRVMVSFFGSFSIVIVGFLPGVTPRLGLTLAADALAVFGLVWSLWALAYLGRSFSIMPEARKLVTGGPYAFNRHPLYFGEGVAGIGVTLPGLGPAGALMIGLFLGAQYLRMKWEERILAAEFPEYREYASRVPRYFPDPRRQRSR